MKISQKQRRKNRRKIISASVDLMIEKGFKAGFDDYITKPINVDALLTKVEKLLNI